MKNIKKLKLKELYDMHIDIHKQVIAEGLDKVLDEHEVIANELQSRGLLHQEWDTLDMVYKN